MAGSNYAQDYFMLIQADNGTAFYVRLGGQVYSSSAGGHLILSQLKDSTYKLTIGLPGQSTREQHYVLNIRQKDQELRLKEQEGKGFALYDEQTGETRVPEPASGEKEEIRQAGIKKDDAFSRLMAGVVHDTAVLYNTYAMEQVLMDSPAVVKVRPADSSSRVSGVTNPDPVVRDTVSLAMTDALPVSNADTMAAVNPAAVVPSNPRSDTAAFVKSVRRPRSVVKLSERKLPHSLRLAYADHSSGKKADTIILFIPVDTFAVTRGAPRPARTMADSLRVPALRGHGPNPDSPLLGRGQNTVSRPALPAPVTESSRSHPADTLRKSSVTKSTLPFVNSDCHNYATDYDVDKLRVKLLDAAKDEDRIQAARKVFKTRCFTTRQIRALSEVFTTDGAKFHFFETAYPFCSDDQFRELVSLLADPVYSGKFRAMTER